MIQKSGFAMSMEAAASLLLVLTAISCLALFEPRQGFEADFLLCSDAALALSKSSAFSDSRLLAEKTELASGLSGLCISANSQSSCIYRGQARISFTFPVWYDGFVQNATVSCWRQ